ncbi:MAG: BatD family protein [Gammaproteobacteria bacterium]
MKNRIDFRIRVFALIPAVFLYLGLSIVATDAAAAVINVNADRNPVRFDESFTLTFTADSSPDDDPDFSVLEENFQIMNQSQSSNLSLINGNFSKSTSWAVTLVAKKTGRLFVPPVSFGKDHSQPLQIEVLAAVSGAQEEDADILLEVSAQPENPYVQAQVVYTIRFLRRVDIAQASLSEPVLDNAVIQKLDDDRTYSLRRNDHQYAVTERKYAIFPQESGLITIPPLELKADVITPGRYGFFNRRSTRMRRIQSNPVALNVRPVPAEFSGDYWLPAEQVVLEEEWSVNPPVVRVGDPLTQTLKLTASGAPLSLLPDIGKLHFKQEQTSGAVKQYPDQPVLEEKKYFSGVVSSREQKVALIPSNPGSYRTENVQVAWWNTRTDRLEIARLPGITIKALPAAPGSTPNRSSELSTNDEPRSDPSTIADPQTAGLRDAAMASGIWFKVSVFLALGWAGTLVFLVWKKILTKRARNAEKTQYTPSERDICKAVKKACRENLPGEVKDALLAWGALVWPHSPPNNLTGLAAKCGGQLGIQIQKLDRSLYSGRETDWNGTSCWEAFTEYCAAQRPATKKSPRDGGLEPLFKA